MRSGLIAISHVEFLSGLNRVVLIISHKGFMLLFLTTPTFSFLNASTCALGVAWVEKIRKEKKKVWRTLQKKQQQQQLINAARLKVRSHLNERY